jgi:hypothetical protein
MPGALDEWQERLERHFSELAASRFGTGFPIFALEHGLTEAELQEITDLLHSHLAAGLFALRLASWPFGLGSAYGKDATALLANIQENPILMRGARLVALLSIAADRDHPTAYLPRWVW